MTRATLTDAHTTLSFRRTDGHGLIAHVAHSEALSLAVALAQLLPTLRAIVDAEEQEGEPEDPVQPYRLLAIGARVRVCVGPRRGRPAFVRGFPTASTVRVHYEGDPHNVSGDVSRAGIEPW